MDSARLSTVTRGLIRRLVPRTVRNYARKPRATAVWPLVFLELHDGLLRQRGRDPRDVRSPLAECGYDSFECELKPATFESATTGWVKRLVCAASAS
jgi:hypothetical protein